MKRMVGIILTGLLLLGSAGAAAMNEYTLSPFAFETQAMLALTFGEQAEQAKLDDRDYMFYTLPDSNGAPFCGQDDTFGFGQTRFMIYTPLVASESHEPDLDDNVEPSGVAKCALTAQQAQVKAEAWLAQLGVTDTYLQSVTAYGRLHQLSGGYMLAFGQQLDGAPVYWAASTHAEETVEPQYSSSSNRLEVVVGDSGLVTVYGFWSAFTPAKQGISVLSEEEAVAAFVQLGEQADTAELCYLLTGTKDAAFATPAYRFQNRFIGAADGKVLQ